MLADSDATRTVEDDPADVFGQLHLVHGEGRDVRQERSHPPSPERPPPNHDAPLVLFWTSGGNLVLGNERDKQVIHFAGALGHERAKFRAGGERVGLNFDRGVRQYGAFFDGVGRGRWVVPAVDENDARIVAGREGDELREDGFGHVQDT